MPCVFVSAIRGSAATTCSGPFLVLLYVTGIIYQYVDTRGFAGRLT